MARNWLYTCIFSIIWASLDCWRYQTDADKRDSLAFQEFQERISPSQGVSIHWHEWTLILYFVSRLRSISYLEWTSQSKYGHRKISRAIFWWVTIDVARVVRVLIVSSWHRAQITKYVSNSHQNPGIAEWPISLHLSKPMHRGPKKSWELKLLIRGCLGSNCAV